MMLICVSSTAVIKEETFSPLVNASLPNFLQVGYHPEHNSPCFKLVRKDGTVEDFSYHKCVLGALQVIAPSKVPTYITRMRRDGSPQN